MRVLIVDDDRDLAESIALALEGRGHTVEVTGLGEDAIARFSVSDFDIAFMDVQLPGLNGVESFLEIRKRKPDARVIMMTGYSVEQLLELALKNGAWGVFHKPFDVQKMFDIIESIQKKGILIADDDPAFVLSLTKTLRTNGYTVHTASDGQQAIDFVRQNPIDALILDLRLPVLDGLETYLALKKEGRNVPTIVVTALKKEEDVRLQTLNTLSVEGIMQKPFDFNEILTELEQLSHE